MVAVLRCTEQLKHCSMKPAHYKCILQHEASLLRFPDHHVTVELHLHSINGMLQHICRHPTVNFLPSNACKSLLTIRSLHLAMIH